MEREEFIQLAKKMTPRGFGVKISKNPELKKILWELTSFLPKNAPQSLRIWCIRENILSEEKLPKCPVCGKIPAFSTGKFLTYCSKRCAQLDKEKFLKKYGVEHHLKSKETKEKRRKTVLEKYGVDNIGKITRDKAKETTLKRYGVDNYTKTEEYKRKAQETSLRKYGTSHPMQNPEIKRKLQNRLEKIRDVIIEKQRQTFLEKYGVNSPMEIPSVKEKVLQSYKKRVWERLNIKLNSINIEPLFSFDDFKSFKVKTRQKLLFLCKTCNTKFLYHLNNGHLPVCPICYKGTNPERKVIEFLKSLDIPFEVNNRDVLNSYEIDVFLPEKRLGIEINGIYYHTFENLITFRGLSEKEAKNYHRLKWIISQEKGINLLQFWDSEVLRKEQIVFSIISSYLGKNKKIYAKDCKIVELKEAEAFKFFTENHLANEVILGKNLGLVYKNELVSAISIGKARFGLKGYEIYRFSNKVFTNVVGALGKLIKYSLKHFDGDLYSYVDLRVFSGKSLEKIGFKRVKITEPDYYYTKDFINLISRQNFMKLKTGIDEKTFVKENGYQKIYAVGNALYKLTV